LSGYYRMYRGWMDSPVFGNEEFTRAQAWEWLISEAAWKDRTITVRFSAVRLTRGTLCKSVRVLGQEWKWEPTKVHRFLQRLQDAEMISIKTATGMQQITICNYDKYQVPDENSATDMQQPCNADATTIEELKDLKEDSISRGTRKPDAEPDRDFDAWYAAYPRRVDPGRARRAYASARKKTTPDVLLSGARAYAVECADRESQYIKHPATWLNAEAWKNGDPPAPALPLLGLAVDNTKPKAEEFDEERYRWRSRCHLHFVRGIQWDNGWGPAPGQRWCEIPPDILAEFQNLAVAK
jgi:hypothetical protein